MIRILNILALAIALQVNDIHAQEQLPEEKRALIIEFLEISNALELGRQMSNAFMTQMLPILKNENPEMSDTVVALSMEIADEVYLEMSGELLEHMVQLYDKFFTAEEVTGMIEFYRSPIGIKTLAVMPALIQESTAATQSWNERYVATFKERYEARIADGASD